MGVSASPSGFTLLAAGAAYSTGERPSDYQSVGVEVAFDSSRGARCQKATGLMNSFKRVLTWPKVICDLCNVSLDVWRKMESTGPHLDFFNSTFNFRYRCWKCVLEGEDSIKTEAEAKIFIVENRKGFQKRERAKR